MYIIKVNDKCWTACKWESVMTVSKYIHVINKINNDLEVAHPQSGSSSSWFLVELEFGNVGFWGDGKTWVRKEKPLEARERINNKPAPNKTRVFHLHAWNQCFHLCTHYAFMYHPIKHCQDAQTQGLMHPWDERNLLVYLVTSQRACWGFIETYCIHLCL